MPKYSVGPAHRYLNSQLKTLVNRISSPTADGTGCKHRVILGVTGPDDATLTLGVDDGGGVDENLLTVRLRENKGSGLFPVVELPVAAIEYSTCAQELVK